MATSPHSSHLSRQESSFSEITRIICHQKGIESRLARVMEEQKVSIERVDALVSSNVSAREEIQMVQANIEKLDDKLNEVQAKIKTTASNTANDRIVGAIVLGLLATGIIIHYWHH